MDKTVSNPLPKLKRGEWFGIFALQGSDGHEYYSVEWSNMRGAPCGVTQFFQAAVALHDQLNRIFTGGR